MAAKSKVWRWVALLVAVHLSLGCSPLMSLFFLLPNTEPKMQPDFRLASEDKYREIKVAVLASYAGEPRPEFIKVDHELSLLLVRRLQEKCKLNKEKVVLIPAHKVAGFKDRNPDWASKSPKEIGDHFHVDYVIDLEITSLSLFEEGSHNDLYRGRGAISVSVIDCTQPDEDAVFSKEYSSLYPESGPVPVDSKSLLQFRQAFLSRVATDLTWFFTAHLVTEHHERN